MVEASLFSLPTAASGMLLLAVLSVWIRRQPCVWQGCAAVALVLNVISGLTSLAAVPLLALFAAACRRMHARFDERNEFHARDASWALIVVGLAVVIVLDPWDAFEKLRWFGPEVISEHAAPVTFSFDPAKAWVGLLLIARWRHASAPSVMWRAVAGTTGVAFMVTASIVFAVAWGLGIVAVDAKWIAVFPLWALTHLLVTCVAEEALFRGVLQRTGMRIWGHRRGGAPAVWVGVAVLFGAVHLWGGAEYAALAALAGLGYGWAYWRTGAIEAAIGTHFLLNTAHLLLFTYPRVG